MIQKFGNFVGFSIVLGVMMISINYERFVYPDSNPLCHFSRETFLSQLHQMLIKVWKVQEISIQFDECMNCGIDWKHLKYFIPKAKLMLLSFMRNL